MRDFVPAGTLANEKLPLPSVRATVRVPMRTAALTMGLPSLSDT